MLRKCSAMCVAMVALVALLMTVGGRASAASSNPQYVYVNAQLATSLPTYIWCNSYQYQGQVGGDFYIGDTSGVNFFHGSPIVMTFASGSQAHLEGIGSWNGQFATFSVDFTGDTLVKFRIDSFGSTVWSSGFAVADTGAGMGYLWAGVYMQP